MSDRYHHGDLPNALRLAAVDVITEKGIGNFSLREVARRAGVSHTAPAHHFGDMRGLLTSLAIEGFDGMHAAMSEAIARFDDPADQLVELGVAYVSLAGTHGAHCQVMFRHDIVYPDDQQLSEAGLRTYGLLHDRVSSLISGEGLAADPDIATNMCWSTVQGLVQLSGEMDHVDELLGNPARPATDRAREFGPMLVAAIRNSS